MGAVIGAKKVKILPRGLQLFLDAGDTQSYPGSGNSWYDLSGNSRTFTQRNTPTFFNSGSSSFFRFNGTNQDFISTVGSNQFNFGTNAATTGLTIEIGTIPSNSIAVHFTFGRDAENSSTAWALHMQLQGGLISFDSVNNNINRLDISAGNDILTKIQTWSLVVRGGSYRAIYKNGAFVASKTDTISQDWAWGSYFPRLGSRQGSFSDYYYTGDIYFFRAYNVGLTDAEIATNYAMDKSRILNLA
jgi:hypothetical protein